MINTGVTDFSPYPVPYGDLYADPYASMQQGVPQSYPTRFPVYNGGRTRPDFYNNDMGGIPTGQPVANSGGGAMAGYSSGGGGGGGMNAVGATRSSGGNANAATGEAPNLAVTSTDGESYSDTPFGFDESEMSEPIAEGDSGGGDGGGDASSSE